MEPTRETRNTPPDVHLETTNEEQQSGVMDLDLDDPELEAWLAAREFELEERSWALADQFDEDWRP